MLADTLRHLTDQGIIHSSDYLSKVDSTNSHAVRWLSQPTNLSSDQAAWLPRLIVADQQTAGRGRMGNQWFSCDDGLTMSLIISTSGELVSIATGVAVAAAIESIANLTEPCGVKWPNDIWINHHKVAGILIECVHCSVVIGIGINIADKPALQEIEVTSVQESSGTPVAKDDMLLALVPELIRRLNQAETDPGALLADYRERCVLTGQQVSATASNQPVAGQCLGIDDSGHLRIQTPGGVHVCNSGEVQRIRPGSW